MTYPMEISMGPRRVNIYAMMEQTRRIYTDGRRSIPNPTQLTTEIGRPLGGGHSGGHEFWIARGHRPRVLRAAQDEQMIAYERFWLADDNTLRDEITFGRRQVLCENPGTRDQDVQASATDFTLLPYVCLGK